MNGATIGAGLDAAAETDGDTAATDAAAGGRPLLVVAFSLVAVLLVVVVVVGQFDTPEIPIIDPDTPIPLEVMQPMAEDGVLPVPAVGEVIAAYLADGRPVFITHPAEGDVLVLDAMSPHAPHGANELMAFCPSSGWFEDYYHGSRFNPWGDWTSGPAPTALPAYPSELSSGGETVRVTAEVEEGRDRTDERGDGQPQQGPTCAPNRDAPVEAIVHRPPDPAPAMDGDEVPSDRWVWATLVLGGTNDAPLVCSTDGTCTDDAPPVAGARMNGTGALLDRAPAVYLARRDAGDGVQLIRPADPHDHTTPLPGTETQNLYPVPPPGEVIAVQLPDRTPVFIAHREDGEVHVLEAWSNQRPATLVGWCTTERQFADVHSSRYDDAGQALGAPPSARLSTYPFETVQVGETAAVRITGTPDDRTEDPPTDGRQPENMPDCAGGSWVSHQPSEDTHVYDDGVQIRGERWRWVRMRVDRFDGDLYLCASNDQPCGRRGDPNAGSICGQQREGAAGEPDCRPYRDPVVVTESIAPFETPRLLLVRGSDDGRTAHLRKPFPDDSRD